MAWAKSNTAKRVIIVPNQVPAAAKEGSTTGQRPRIDVVEIERLHQIPLIEMKEGEARPRLPGWTRMMRTAYQALKRTRGARAAYITGEEFGIPLALVARALKLDRPRLIVRLENLQQGRSQGRSIVFESLLRQALERIDLVLCRNSVNHQLLLNVYGAHPSRVRVCRDSVDTKFYDPNLPPQVLPDFHVPARPFIFTAGMERRDYGVFIEAVRNLNVHAIIAASSPWSMYRLDDGTTRDLPSNVTVASYNPMQMRELYRAASFVVIPLLPTLRTCGVSILTEAWAMGKGVVTTATAGLMDIIRPGTNCLAAPPCDASALRKAIAQLVDDSELCAQLGRAGRECSLRDHLFEDYVDTLVSSLDDLVD